MKKAFWFTITLTALMVGLNLLARGAIPTSGSDAGFSLSEVLAALFPA